MKVELPIIYSQWDTRWADTLLGFNTNQPFNIYNYGCFISSWAMVCQYYGKSIDPAQLNQKLKDLGPGKGFTAGGGDYVPGGVNKIYGDIKETRTVTPSLLTDAQLAEIKTSIDNGYPVIICIDYNPKTNQPDTHFVVIVDYNNNDENDFTIADPLGGKIRSLKDYLGWLKPNVRNTIESYVITSGPKPKLNSDTIPVLKTDFANLVHGSSEYDKIVEYLKPGADPKTTQFEDLQTVVAGIKSRQTDLENQLKQAILDKQLAEQEVVNQKDKLANVTADCQRQLTLKTAEYDALKATVPDVQKLKGQYEGTIDELQGELREAQKQVGLKDLEITKLKNDVEVVGWLDKLIQWVKSRVEK
jgi:uncharacterized protein YvpB